ncbi:MAG: pre-toxin TG domain-containing protein, partial [Parachlamydia sp.]|nr:pre-toxin TG domain-containing protein [Parachlamydia sp.]
CPMGGKLTTQSHGQAIALHNEASAGLQIASFIADFVPIVCTIKAVIEVATGVDPVTGQPTSRLEAAAGLIPGGKAVTKGGKVVKAIVKGEKGAAKAAKTAAKTEKAAASSTKAASKGEKAAAKNAHTPTAANENNFQGKAANENSATSSANHERYKTELRKDMQKPNVENPDLEKIMDYTYRPNAKVGSGSTAAAIREEAMTGGQVGGKTHSQKGQDVMNSLADWMKKNQANDTIKAKDMDAAKNVYLDLKDALGK